MKNYKILISRITRAAKMLFFGGMVMVASSCEDFLTILPTDKIVLEDFWKTKGDVESVAAESYRLMAQWDFLSRVLVWGELRGDNVVEGNFSGNTDIINIVDANLLPSNGYASWATFYQIINNCNVVLKYAAGVLNEDPDFTLGDYDVICGEMYAIRALCHFYLVRTFRDVPLLTQAMVDNTQNLYQKQETPVTVLNACLDDLYKAENLVLSSGNYSGRDALKNKGRFTKDAVRAMIADVLLWKAAFLAQQNGGAAIGAEAAEVKECYTKCVEYCDLVLDARVTYWKNNETTETTLKSLFQKATYKTIKAEGSEQQVTYPLLFARDGDLVAVTQRFQYNHAPYMALFGECSEALGESIFEIQHTKSKDNGNCEIPYFYGCADDKGTFKIGLLSASKYLAGGTSILKGDSYLYSKGDFRRVTYMNAQFADEKNDKYAIVKYGYGASKEDRRKLTDSNEDNIRFGKVTFTFWKNSSDGGRSRFSENQVNWIVYRMSDVMLMKAEALALRNEPEDLQKAFQLVNVVNLRSQTRHPYGDGLLFPDKADVPQLADYTTAEAMYKLVLDERQREFAFEAKRWYDLVRFALHYNSTDEMLTIIEKANNMPETKTEYRMKMASINKLFFPIAEREINVSNGTLVQNPAYVVDDEYAKN